MFSTDVLRACWDDEIAIYAGSNDGRCPCERSRHGHEDTCWRPMRWNAKSGPSIWRAHLRRSEGSPTTANCMILCGVCSDFFEETRKALQNGAVIEFPDHVVRQRWNITNALYEGSREGRCICERTSHDKHPNELCDAVIYWGSRNGGRGHWQANHIRRPQHEGLGTLSNCEILCITCHQQVTGLQRARDPDW